MRAERPRADNASSGMKKFKIVEPGRKRTQKNLIEIIPAENLKAVAKIDTRTYPGTPSDIQAPFGVLATQAQGKTLIHDSLYESRFNYVAELVRMGANANVLDPHRVEITGPTKLTGTEITSFDLRAGVSLIIAALLAEGKSVINEIYQVDRGYEKIEKRLKKLGADIKRIKISDANNANGHANDVNDLHHSRLESPPLARPADSHDNHEEILPSHPKIPSPFQNKGNQQ